MTEATVPSGASPLKQARLERGLSLEALSTMLKVAPGKLEALESGRYQELPDAAFARALALTVCRVLHIEAAPVLALLPKAGPVSLIANEPNEVPFEASRARLNLDVNAGVPWSVVLAPRWLVPIAVLLAAALVYVWPNDIAWPTWMTWPDSARQQAPLPATSVAASDPLSESATDMMPITSITSITPVMPVVPVVPVVVAASIPSVRPLAAPAVLAPPTAGSHAAATSSVSVPGLSVSMANTLVLATTEESWIDVRDARGAKVMSRHVRAGETMGLEGRAPLYVKIGNANGVRVSYRGHPIELAAFTRNNVATLELK